MSRVEQIEQVEQAAKLFRSCFPAGHPHQEACTPGSLVSLLYQDQNLIGAALLRRKRLHPVYPEIIMAIVPEQRRRGFGRSLHRQLLAEHPLLPGEAGPDACCYRDQPGATAFLQALGYQAYLDCHLIDFSLAALERLSPDLGTDTRLLSLSEYVAGGGDIRTIARFLIARYHTAHHWSPPLDHPEPVWQQLALQDIDPALSSVVVVRDQILACSTGCRGNEGLEIIWSYALSETPAQELALLKAVMGFQARLARGAGLEFANLEADSTERALTAVRLGLPLQSEQVWMRLRLARDLKNFQ